MQEYEQELLNRIDEVVGLAGDAPRPEVVAIITVGAAVLERLDRIADLVEGRELSQKPDG